jgi:FtsP/CotA-like multicopper oxidase with cupredoxin domain
MNKLIVILLFCGYGFTFLAQDDVNFLIISRNTGTKVLANNQAIQVFGFATSLSAQPTIPGPTITAKEGDSVHIDLWNVSQGAPHTIHLHGLDVNQQNDGVGHLSFEVAHMDHGFYHFKAPHAGTYLYHCHVTSPIHVQAGMYGLIIIKPSDGSNTTWNDGYAFEREHSYFMSEIDTNWHVDSILNHEHDTSMMVAPFHIPFYGPQFFLINGLSDNQLVDADVSFNSAANEVNYVRLTNIGYYGVRVIFPEVLNSKMIDSDGRPLPNMEESDTVYVYPGERYGVLAESSVEYEGEIQYEYFDLNTMTVHNTQVVPVHIAGFASLNSSVLENESFKVVPNPVDDDFSVHIQSDVSDEISIEILDMQGRFVGAKQIALVQVGKNVIPINHQITEAGSYFVRLSSKGKIDQIQKVIKL